jgi:uncharacterized protein YyaL (SSP411 family)
MTHPEGGFFSAEDADSLPTHDATHKDEGAFYVWTTQEIRDALGADNAAIFSHYYGLQIRGNAPPQGDPHGEFKGKNIPYRSMPIEQVAQLHKRGVEEVEAILEASRKQLFAVRNQRPRPHRDEKIIVAWNGLMISAFARAAQILDEPRYLEAAQRAADFIRRELFDGEGSTLLRHYKDGPAAVAAFADDYAFLVRGLLDLYEASFEYAYLQWAEQLTDTLNSKFYDDENGGYYNSAPDPHVLLRMKEDYDGAEPSANSIVAMNNLRLAHFLDRNDLRDKAEATLQAFAARSQDVPSAMPALLAAAIYSTTPPLHIVIVGQGEAEDTRTLLRTVHERFLPSKTLVLIDSEKNQLAHRMPFMAGMTMQEDKATAYVCHNFACRQPVTSVDELRTQLTSL